MAELFVYDCAELIYDDDDDEIAYFTVR